MPPERRASPDDWLRATPRARAGAAARALGRPTFAAWCGDVLTGRANLTEDGPARFDPRWLAGIQWTAWGPASTWPARGLDYWPRVWAARSLLHCWDPGAEPDVLIGLDDPHWRVREMCAKVATRHEIVVAADRSAELAAFDEAPRVRIAALRALAMTAEAEHCWAIRAALDDPAAAVRERASTSKDVVERRLDRPLPSEPGPDRLGHLGKWVAGGG